MVLKIITFIAFIGFAFMQSSNAQDADFLKPPKIFRNPDARYEVINRKFQGIPSLAISNGGRLWAIWYAGETPGEDHNNYVVVSTSQDNGKTWTETLVIDPDGKGPMRAYDPEVWIDPNGKLWVFWTQTIGMNGTVAGVWSTSTNHADAADPEWSEPRRLTDGVMMCKPIVLSSGEWVLPASTWRLTDYSARMVVSSDQGKTWRVRGAVHVPKDEREFDEHMIVERKDGTLWMLVRTKYGIGESVSEDRGKTWSALRRSPFDHPSARFFIRRLQSGNLLLIKHGPMDRSIGRSHLTAYFSADDGKTWTGGLLLDERESISYPDGQQNANGRIYIIYDRARTEEREILMAIFSEEDIIAADSEAPGVSLRIIVSKYPQ